VEGRGGGGGGGGGVGQIRPWQAEEWTRKAARKLQGVSRVEVGVSHDKSNLARKVLCSQRRAGKEL